MFWFENKPSGNPVVERKRRRQSSVARFFLVAHTKNGKSIPNNHNMYPMAVKYT
jgi:hypothetical protein